MHLRVRRRGAAVIALLLSLSSLRADITLPTAAPSPPPQADSLTVRILRGERIIIPLRGHHGGSGSVTFWIAEPPTHGTLLELRVLGDNRATVVYQNDGAEPAASDRFTYLVKTSSDRASSPAEVRIVVEEPPPHLQVPGRIGFDQIMAGESQTRDLAITNSGGGVIEGRLTVSAPWRLTTPDYRVASGKSAKVPIVFQPDEGREFVGQITLIGADGASNSVALEGSATAPVTLDPPELRIAPPEKEKAPRTGSVALTNRTDRPVPLEFSASRSIQPIANLTLAPGEEKTIPVVVASDRTGPVSETILVRGEGFLARLPVEAAALMVKPTPSITPRLANHPVASAAPTASPSRPVAAPANAARLETPAAATATSPSHLFVPVRGKRLEGTRWELRWARPKETIPQYRIEERFLVVDGAGELQATWRAFTSPEIATAGDEVTAQVSGLDAQKIHSLRVTALGTNGAALWESPLVVLGPPPEPSHRARNWALILGGALLVLLVLRWRSNRPLP